MKLYNEALNNKKYITIYFIKTVLQPGKAYNKEDVKLFTVVGKSENFRISSIKQRELLEFFEHESGSIWHRTKVAQYPQSRQRRTVFCADDINDAGAD